MSFLFAEWFGPSVFKLIPKQVKRFHNHSTHLRAELEGLKDEILKLKRGMTLVRTVALQDKEVIIG